MKITEEHKKLFQHAAELFESDPSRLWLCPTITSAFSERLNQSVDWNLIHECRQILHEVFNPSDRTVIWHFIEDCNNDYDFARNCRIIALYSLIYADL